MSQVKPQSEQEEIKIENPFEGSFQADRGLGIIISRQKIFLVH